MLTRLAVFLGSSDGADSRTGEATYEVGRDLAERGIELVYGGGRTGLMGRLAAGVLDHGGTVCGVIPRFMVEREWALPEDDQVELHVVESMHERKALMAHRADAFLALPGGLGTLEELFEVWTWQTLALHAKPVGLLDVDGFWKPLLATLTELADRGFLAAETVAGLVVADDLDQALTGLDARARSLW